MNVLEYEFIKNQSNRIVGIEDLSDLTPRTLILGKTDAQHIYQPKGDCYLHIYIEDREIKRYIYDAETGEGVLLSINKNIDYIPTYYAFPQYSDFEFSLLLNQAGNVLRMERFKEPILKANPYYGEIKKSV